MAFFHFQAHQGDLINTNTLITEVYEAGFGVKKFGGFEDFQSFLGCF
jgi:hypothetical protein